MSSATTRLQLFELAGADPLRRFSPYCWRTCLALLHKGLDWETIPWRFSDQARIAPYRSRTVPVLLDGDAAIVDSTVIATYLDERYPARPLLYGSADARALGVFVHSWIDRALFPLVARMIVRDIVDILDPRDVAYFRESRERRYGTTLEAVVADREQTRERFVKALDPLRAMLARQPFLGGSASNYADYMVFGVFAWARGVSTFRLLAEDDPVHAWRERILGLFGGYARAANGFEV